MRPLLLITFLAICQSGFAQIDSFDIYLWKGKEEFKKVFDEQDFALAAENLEKAVRLRPNHAEAHYFLGYAYSRLNSEDGHGMLDMSLPLTIKTSNELETVNSLSPKYTGELVVLDPYSKIAAEWGSMAMSYINNNKPDSAIWAFREGRRRGGFTDFILAINRATLDGCTDSALLVSYGDNFTITLWYLQYVEGYRKDVSVIDVGLLNTSWYTSYLIKNGIASFALDDKAVDSIAYADNKDFELSIGNFSWTLNSNRESQYLMRGERVLYHILKANNFNRDVYFTIAFSDDDGLGLGNHLAEMIVVDKLDTSGQAIINHEQIIDKYMPTFKTADPNSLYQYALFDVVRTTIFQIIYKEMENGNNAAAKALLSKLDQHVNEEKYPYQHASVKDYVTAVRRMVLE